MEFTILTQSWPVLLTFASGYAGYYVANVGAREHHRPIDVTFATLVYGFFGALAFQSLYRQGVGISLASISAFAATIFLGALWSRVGRKVLEEWMRTTRISHSDDLPTAWLALSRETGCKTLQLSVKTIDGTWLKTDDLRKFEHAPNGPCILGGSGDILMYVTHEKGPQDEDFEAAPEVDHETWGREITYLPRDRVARVDIRRI